MTIDDTSPTGLWQAAGDGRFRLEADAARECAAHYGWIAEELTARIGEARELNRLSGFGGFDSAQQLQGGFEGKAQQAVDALTGARQTCRELQAAVLRAGGLLAEQDLTTAAAMIHHAEKVS
ncbi:hypothetical protein ACFVVM_07575 [Nocardia sp. NPDC058176]|uniref:hypothetical protein n=1 Tax=Nocardia sp. NPDC058176 TaxID=3346368 RepID=UPI0036D946EB